MCWLRPICLLLLAPSYSKNLQLRRAPFCTYNTYIALIATLSSCLYVCSRLELQCWLWCRKTCVNKSASLYMNLVLELTMTWALRIWNRIITSAWGAQSMFSWKAFKGKTTSIMLGYECMPWYTHILAGLLHVAMYAFCSAATSGSCSKGTFKLKSFLSTVIWTSLQSIQNHCWSYVGFD